MRNVTIGVVQMRCGTDAAENIEKAERLARKAAEQGADNLPLSSSSTARIKIIINHK